MSNEIKMTGIPQLNVNELIEMLSNSYVSIIKSGGQVKDFPSSMLWSAPGMGKSQAVYQIAEKIEQATNLKTNVKDVRLLLMTPVDMMGIPVADEKRTKAVWLRPEMFDLDSSKDVINILFLDEISACAPSLQAAAYSLVLDRKVGEHKLPDNTIVIAAGNRVTDKSVAFKMPKALANRFIHFEVTNTFESWRNWALHHNINPIVLGFLSFRPDYLNTFDPTNEALSFATSRTWELVSNVLNNVSNKLEDVYPIICGLVGTGVALELKGWYKTYSKLPKIADIFNGKVTDVPTESSSQFAICCSLYNQVKTGKVNHEQILNSVTYASKMYKEFFMLLIKEYLSVSEDLKKDLISDPTFIKYVNNGSAIMNGQSNGYFKN